MKFIVLATILLVIVSMGIQQSFAEQASGKPAWETNSDKVCGDKLCSEIEDKEKKTNLGNLLQPGDYYHYQLCTVGHNECSDISLKLWYERESTYREQPVWIVHAVVYDGEFIEKGDMKLDKSTLKPLQYKSKLESYASAFGKYRFEVIEHEKNISEYPFKNITSSVGIPPIGKFVMGNLRITDTDGIPLAKVVVNQRVLATADIAYSEHNETPFVWIIQIKDFTGDVVHLSWIEGIINAGNSLSPEVSWIPKKSDKYVVTAFYWESFKSPIPIGLPVSTNVNVNDSNSATEFGIGKSKSTVEYHTEKDVFNLGEPITITAKNVSYQSLRGPSIPCGFTISDEHGQQVANFWGIASAICSFKPRDEIIKTWDGRYSNGEPVRPGLYTISGNYQGEIPKKIQLLDPTDSYDLLDNPPELEEIKRLINSEVVFSGILESKTNPFSVPEFFDLKFSVTENFKRAYNESIEVSVHEGAWKNCAGLQEGEDYLVFVLLDKKKLITDKDKLRCYHALELPSDVVVELREFSSHFPWWLNQ